MLANSSWNVAGDTPGAFLCNCFLLKLFPSPPLRPFQCSRMTILPPFASWFPCMWHGARCMRKEQNNEHHMFAMAWEWASIGVQSTTAEQEDWTVAAETSVNGFQNWASPWGAQWMSNLYFNSSKDIFLFENKTYVNWRTTTPLTLRLVKDHNNQLRVGRCSFITPWTPQKPLKGELSKQRQSFCLSRVRDWELLENTKFVCASLYCTWGRIMVQTVAVYAYWNTFTPILIFLFHMAVYAYLSFMISLL